MRFEREKEREGGREKTKRVHAYAKFSSNTQRFYRYTRFSKSATLCIVVYILPPFFFLLNVKHCFKLFTDRDAARWNSYAIEEGISVTKDDLEMVNLIFLTEIWQDLHKRVRG